MGMRISSGITPAGITRKTREVFPGGEAWCRPGQRVPDTCNKHGCLREYT